MFNIIFSNMVTFKKTLIFYIQFFQKKNLKSTIFNIILCQKKNTLNEYFVQKNIFATRNNHISRKKKKLLNQLLKSMC